MTGNGAKRPKILGIVNVTEDSFSDGGRYLAPEAAIAHARQLAADGADIIDIGAASSNPDAKSVPPAEEIARLGPVIDDLQSHGVAISIDSFDPATQRYALARGVEYLNDIQGFPDPALYPDLAQTETRLIVLHSVQQRGKATRIETDAADIWPRVERFFEARIVALAAAGIDRDRLILDPGMGFFLGANPEPSLTMLRQISRLKERFDLPVLVSVSRKSFLRTVTERPVESVGPATLAAEIYAATQDVDYLRTHAAGPLADALRVWEALARAS